MDKGARNAIRANTVPITRSHPARLIPSRYPPNTLSIPARLARGPVSARRTGLVTTYSRLASGRAGRHAGPSMRGPGSLGRRCDAICHSFLSTILFFAASLRECGARSW